MWRVPQAIYSEGRHRFRARPYTASKDAAGRSPYYQQQKGISAHQLGRILEVQYKSAWFLAHRIREAMRSGDLAPFGSGGGEVDETYFGARKGVAKAKGGHAHKFGVLSLVDRDTRTMRSFTFDKYRADEVHPIVRANIAREARLMTDEARMYAKIGKEFAEHGTTPHGAKQYVDYDDRTIHTNTLKARFPFSSAA